MILKDILKYLKIYITQTGERVVRDGGLKCNQPEAQWPRHTYLTLLKSHCQTLSYSVANRPNTGWQDDQRNEEGPEEVGRQHVGERQ